MQVNKYIMLMTGVLVCLRSESSTLMANGCSLYVTHLMLGGAAVAYQPPSGVRCGHGEGQGRGALVWHRAGVHPPQLQHQTPPWCTTAAAIVTCLQSDADCEL